jgi:hypothetical protein
VLIRHRDQTRQPHQVFLLGERIVHPGVAGVHGQVLDRLGHRGGVRVRGRLHRDLIRPQRSNQGHALRCGEREIETVHSALPKCAAARTVWSDPVIEPARHDPRISLPTHALGIGQPDRSRRSARIPGHQPHRSPRLVLGVVLPQPSTGGLQIRVRSLSRLGGINVIIDRPTLQLRDR